MVRTFRLLAVGFAAALTSFGQLNAPAFGEDAPETVVAAPDQSGTIMHIVLEVEGERLNTRKTLSPNGVELYDARPIIEALKGEITVDETVLKVRRFQDGAIMQVDMADGSVFANDVLLGKMPDWEARTTADTWLDLNGVSVITGTHVSENDAGQIVLELDERLKPQFDLDLFVDGARIAFPTAEPRTIGAVLLIPLRDVVDAFGHTLEEDSDNGTVTVTRIQDSARFTLELATGLVSVNDEPRGVTPNVSYIDPFELLLPFTAVETLTGSHIVLEPGSDRIDVTLDERLAGGAMPGARVDDDAARTPLTLERLSFQLSDAGRIGATLSAHVRQFNTNTHYEAAGSLAEPEALQPAWLQMEVRSLSGWYATLGDATPRHRELNGVDTSRIRGITFSKITGGGKLLSIAAGTRLDGTKKVTNSASVPVFSGFAAGARLIDPETSRELALAVATDGSGENARVVGSFQQEIITEAGKMGDVGLGSLFLSGDLGAFSGGNTDSLGIRGQADGIYRLSEQSNLRASLSHESSAFRNNLQSASSDLEGVFDARVSGRSSGQLSIDWRAANQWKILPNFGAATRIAATQQGDQTTTSITGSASGLLGTSGVRVAVDASVSHISGADEISSQSSDSVTIRTQRDFKWGEVQGTLSSAGTEDGRSTRLVTNVNIHPISRNLENGAGVIFSPSVSAVASDRSQFARMGASGIATSGEAFGDKFQIRGQVSALQSVSDENADTSFFGSVSARYDFWDALRLEGAFNTDFSDRSQFTLGLRGVVEFNEPRKYREPNEGAGILMGRAFLDRNRDGIRQDDEPGVPGVQVGIRNTRLALRVDGQGNYTIQNLPSGLYTLDINLRSLPLGMLTDEAVLLRATIGDGRVTVLDIPIISSGQVRGSVFIDSDGDGDITPGETRLEGARLTLVSQDDDEFEPKAQIAAGFGQYAFEGLAPGRYKITARFEDRMTSVDFELTEENMFSSQPIPLPPTDTAPDITKPDGEVAFIASLPAPGSL